MNAPNSIDQGSRNTMFTGAKTVQVAIKLTWPIVAAIMTASGK